MKKIAKIPISGKCKPKSKEVVANSQYTFGDAVDYFAMAILNPSKRLEMDIKITQNEIEDIKRQVDWLSLELETKKLHLENLQNEWDIKHGHVDPEFIEKDKETIKESISTVKRICDQFNCEPSNIRQFTGVDTIGHHAKKCELSRSEFLTLVCAEEDLK